ncbi:MAG: Glutamate--tRNA ligase [Verrucomicrobiae bacterium]|nr:Glutamate--tRNA ligase [Verrucomicrobiae bacterium]
MVIGRLAPTPSGGLHLGNARTFLIAWLSARAAGGRIVLRIDDLDRPRVKIGYTEQALADLRWLGLDWDGEPLYQSQRSAAYETALDKLRAAGAVYASTASRRELALAAQAPHANEPSSGDISSDRLPAWRFRVSKQPVDFDDAIHGACAITTDDFVVFRNDGIAAYQLATVVDDHFQGVTEVVRGDDLLSSTPRQILLARALGLPSPRYVHVPLVLDGQSERMAKRRDSTQLAALRAAGAPAAEIIGRLAGSCGWAQAGEHIRPAELLARFDLAKLPRHAVQLTGP